MRRATQLLASRSAAWLHNATSQAQVMQGMEQGISSSALMQLSAPAQPQGQAQSPSEPASMLSARSSLPPGGYTLPSPPSTTVQLMTDVNSTAPLVSQQFASSTDDAFGVQKVGCSACLDATLHAIYACCEPCTLDEPSQCVPELQPVQTFVAGLCAELVHSPVQAAQLPCQDRHCTQS